MFFYAEAYIFELPGLYLLFLFVSGCESIWSQRPGACRHQNHQKQKAIPKPGSNWSQVTGIDEQAWCGK